MNEPSRFVERNVPDWDAPEVIAARIVMTVAMDAYHETGAGGWHIDDERQFSRENRRN